MQADILKNIDVLADMADSTDNIETLEAEIKEIEKRSSKLKKELDFYDDVLPEEKYYRASERLVDENLKASLETKIKKQEQALADLNSELTSDLKTETELHEHQEELAAKISEITEYIKVLKSRETMPYQSLLKEQEKLLADLTSELEETKKKYTEITNKIDILNLAKAERDEKLKHEKEKLSDTKACLINPASYIDYDMKKIDDARVEEIKDELLKLDKRRLEILTDPAMIAKDAKDLILDDDRTSALAKIKELVTIAKTKPFMDIPNGSELTNILQDELTAASEKRDEFAAVIENKDYMGSSNMVVADRIEFLNHKIDSLKAEISTLEEKVQKIDAEDLKELIAAKEKVQNHKEELEQQIIVYEDMLSGDDSDKSPKRKAILNSALIRKQEELTIVSAILEAYLKDEQSMVMKTNTLLEKEIIQLNDEIAKIKKEITELNKLNLGASKIKDVLAIENDKKKLKELDDKVKDIQHRQKYDRTPSEIFDEIEIYFGTLDTTDEEKMDNEEPVFMAPENNEFAEEKAQSDDLALPEEPGNNISDDFVIEKFDVSDNTPDFMNEAKETAEERKKVIKVEKLDKDSHDESDEDDFIIGDYKDDDYLDMSSLFNDNNGVL